MVFKGTFTTPKMWVSYVGDGFSTPFSPPFLFPLLHVAEIGGRRNFDAADKSCSCSVRGDEAVTYKYENVVKSSESFYDKISVECF